MPILSVFAPLLKRRFSAAAFAAKRMPTRWPEVAILLLPCYNTPNESEGICMHKILFVCHGRISPNCENSLCF